MPIGIDSFEKLRREDFYYVDKTGLIVDLMKNWGEVNLFTRPRRFGKTLNMNMLKCFFEVGTDKSLFDGLAVTKDEKLCETYMGQYPVVFVTLKGVDGLNYETAYKALCNIIVFEARRLRILAESEKLATDEKVYLQRLISAEYTADDIRVGLQMLCRLLEKHYGKKAILLIDEYDVPLDKAYAQGYYPQMIDLIRGMFGAALKTNDSLFFAVLTGCLRVSKESIFTGLNNLKVRSISDLEFDEYFGFTDANVRQMLCDYALDDHYEDAREWYDGYLFGGQNVYCPWDVINYCDTLRCDPHAEPKAYWLNTSGNAMVRRLINKAQNGTTRMEIEDLIAGRTITKTLNENLTHSEIDSSIDNIWSLLYMTGYLTITKRPSGGRYELRIPNREVRQIFKDQVLSRFKDRSRANADKLSELYAAFEGGDADAIARILNRQLLTTVSYYDSSESFYHGFMAALLSACDRWAVSSNDEAGDGRADLIVEREDGEFGFVVEPKAVRDIKKLDEACENAMRQIEEKDYTANLRYFGIEKIWTYAIAFCRKKCRVICRQDSRCDY